MALASGQITLVDLTDNITSGSIIASSLTVYAGSNDPVTLTCNYSNAENATTTYTWYHSSIDEENKISNTGSTNGNTCIVYPTNQGIINGSVLYFCRVSSGSVIQDFQISIQVINKMEYLSITPETFFIDTDINGHFSEGSFTTSEIVINLVDENNKGISLLSNPSLIDEDNRVSISFPDPEDNKIFKLTLTQEKINSFSNSSDLVSFTFTTINGITYEKGISFVKNKIDNRNSGYTVFLTKEVVSLANNNRSAEDPGITHTFTSKIKAFYGNREVEIEDIQVDEQNTRVSLKHQQNYVIQGKIDNDENIQGFYFTYDNITKELSFFHNAKIGGQNLNTFNFYVKLKNKEGYFVLPFTYYLYNYGYQLLYEETNIPFTWNLDLENYNTQAIIVKSLQYSETEESNEISLYTNGLWDFEITTNNNNKIPIENGSSLPVFLSKLNDYSYNINLVKLKEIHGQVRSISVILKSAGAIVSKQNFPVVYGEGSKIGGENLLLNSKDFSEWDTKVNNITLGTGEKQESNGEILIVTPEQSNSENGDFSIISFYIPTITIGETNYAPRWSYARTPYLPFPKNYINKTFCLSFDVQFSSMELDSQTKDFSQNFVVVLSAHKTIADNKSHRSRYGVLATINLSNSTYSGLSVIENKNNYSNWQRVALTFNLNEDLLLDTDNKDDENNTLSPTPLDECIGLRIYFHLQDIGTLSIKRPKLELGDAPSEWTDSYGEEQFQSFLEGKKILDANGNLLIVTNENFPNLLAT